jgi:hypothetical protein
LPSLATTACNDELKQFVLCVEEVAQQSELRADRKSFLHFLTRQLICHSVHEWQFLKSNGAGSGVPKASAESREIRRLNLLISAFQ